MGDDLVDDWWVKEDIEDKEVSNNIEHDDSSPKKKKKKEQVESSVANENNVENVKKLKKKKKKEKQVKVEEIQNENQSEDKKIIKKKKNLKRKSDNIIEAEVIQPASKKKKKKRKKTLKHIEEYEPTLEGLWKFFQEELQKSLSVIEILDIKPKSDDWYLMATETFKRDDPEQYSLYLKNVVPSWEKKCLALSEKEIKASPLMLILTSSAQRAVDLLRHASSFKGEHCKTVKLFAKHFKVDDQVKHLEENVVHLAVGTPHRILTLIENGSLKIKKLKYLIVDWSWKDVKTRRIINMPNVKDDFVLLFQKYLFSRCQKGALSVGLF